MLGAMSPDHLHPTGASTRPQGVTLIELMVTLAILAILLAIAVPSMQQLIARKRVAGVASELASDIRYLRSMGVQTATLVQIDFGASAAATCYALSTDPFGLGQPCDCNNPSSCDGSSGAPKIVKTVTCRTTDPSPTRLADLFLAGDMRLPQPGVLGRPRTGRKRGEPGASTKTTLRYFGRAACDVDV